MVQLTENSAGAVFGYLGRLQRRRPLMQPAALLRVGLGGEVLGRCAMRYSVPSVTAFLILATFGCSAAQSQTAPSAQQEQSQQGQTQQQSQPPKRESLPGSPQQQRQVDDALNTESGRAGKAEPLPKATTDGPVLVNGALNVPGAPTDSQTVPAKFSTRNATIDKLPTMAAQLSLNDEQR